MNEHTSHRQATDIVAKMGKPLSLSGPLVIQRVHRQNPSDSRLLSLPAVASAIGRHPSTLHNDFASGRIEGVQHGDYTYKVHQPPAPQHAAGGLDALKEIGNEGPDFKLSAAGEDARKRYHDYAGRGRAWNESKSSDEWQRKRDAVIKNEDIATEGIHTKGDADEKPVKTEHEPVQKAEKEYGSGSASLFKPRPAPNAAQSPRDVHAPASRESIESTLGRGTTGEVGHRKEQTPIRKAEKEDPYEDIDFPDGYPQSAAAKRKIDKDNPTHPQPKKVVNPKGEKSVKKAEGEQPVEMAAKSAKLDLTPKEKKSGEAMHERATKGPFAEHERKNVPGMSTEQQVAAAMLHKPIKKSADEAGKIDHTKVVDPSEKKCPKCGSPSAFDNSLGDQAELTCPECGETWKQEGPVKLGREEVGDWTTRESPREQSNRSMRDLEARRHRPEAEPTEATKDADPEEVARGRQYAKEAEERYRGKKEKPVQESRKEPKTARHIKEVRPGRHLYRLEPNQKGEGFGVVSTVENHEGKHESMMFPGTRHGDIKSYDELHSHVTDHKHSHHDAMKEWGYHNAEDK